MFSIRTKAKSIDITTFELDVNVDRALAEGSLDVEVYTIAEGFASFVNDPSAWTPLTTTVGVPIPGGGGLLIPVQDFMPISMKADELRSFYITMKGPYIDNRVMGLDGTGDLDQDLDLLRLDVGAGLSEYKFPAKFDTMTNPKFAGVIHFTDTSSECGVASNTVAETFVEYKFLVDDGGMDDSLITTIDDAVDAFLLAEMDEADGYLKEYASTYSLVQDGKPSSTSGGRQTSKSFCHVSVCVLDALSLFARESSSLFVNCFDSWMSGQLHQLHGGCHINEI
jgi:hypothetical protein